MGRKDNYSFRLSDVAKAYIVYSSKMCGLSESKWLDFLLCSLSANDEYYKQFCHENKEINSDD